MTANVNEQLSALMDGELPAAEVAIAVRRVARDEAHRATAIRYCIIGDALRDELPEGRLVDLVARVRSSLDAEAQSVPPASQSRRRVGRMARIGAGLAIAASVAVVALVAMPGREPAAPPELTTSEVAEPRPAPSLAVPPQFTLTAGGPDRLTRYYVNHSQLAPAMSGRGALTRIIVIQPETRKAQESQSPESRREGGAAQ